MPFLRTALALALAALLAGPTLARAQAVLDWNRTAVDTLIAQGQSPFAQARFMAITQLAVFEAVNAITGQYEPYLGTITAPAGASAEAAAVEAAYRVLKNYFPLNPGLDPARTASLAAIPDGPAETDGIAVGAAAAAAMIAARTGDGSSPPAFSLPASTDPGVWQLTPSCTLAGGAFFHWQNVTPFGVPSTPGDTSWIEAFLPPPPPDIHTSQYAKDYDEVHRVGSVGSTERPQDRTDVARFYAASSPALIFNLAARQLAVAQGRSMSETSRTLAVLNMASNDALVASFFTKYHYYLWRPETAIRAGDLDGNDKTDPDAAFMPFITTPCFPSYPSNHASGSNSANEILRRAHGAAGHDLTIENPGVPAVAGIVLEYNALAQITNDIDDARVYGGIHFRFDQDAGGKLGREIATYIDKHNLRAVHGGR